MRAGGLTVVHEGLTEYELVDRQPDDSVAGSTAGALALTLLRCTGMLSQGPMTSRPLPAGPAIAVEGPQMAGRHRFRYGLAVGEVDPYELVDQAFVPLLLVEPPPTPDETPDETSDGTTDGGARADQGSALSIAGAEVSSVTRVGGKLQVRVWNPSDRPTTVVIDGHDGWLVDLRGHLQTSFEGSFELGPWRIATAVLS